MAHKDPQTKKVNCLDVCSILCCPPLPWRIAEKLTFHPPKPPQYSMPATDSIAISNTFHMSPEADDSGMKHVMQQSSTFIKTVAGNDIAVLYMRCTKTKRFTILFSHGNSVDIGLMHRYCTDLCIMIGCDLVIYDYSGYGQSTGVPTEQNLYSDVMAAWDYTTTWHEKDPRQVVLFGQSLGTAATVDLASKVQCAGVILQSPIASSLRVVCKKRKYFPRCADSFVSIEKVPKITSPVLVIHGTNDEIIDFSHGLAIHDKCPRAVEPLWVEGAGHNDIELYGQYIERLRKFINEELSTSNS